MKQMICYLYEFHNNQKIRNVGFVRIIPYADKVVMQFHGKGLSFHGVEDFEVFLFYMEDGVCYVTSIGRMDGVHGNINNMIEVTGADVTEGKGLDRFDGILILQPQGQIYVAAWKNVDVDVEHMQEMEEEAGPEPEPVIIPEMEAESEQDSSIISESALESEPEVRAESACEAESNSTCEEEPGSEPDCKTESESICGDEVPVEMEPEMQCKDTFPRYEKIVRQDIARLPRKEWKLANNSFLLHGFYNYKHLLFIEEKEQLYLGVPGVYHKKEKEAAMGFGFNQFHRVEEDLNLSDDERNDVDDFGYWCRPVERLYSDHETLE